MEKFLVSHIVVLCAVICSVCCESNFSSLFKECHPNDSSFDNCIKTALNNARPYFKTGVEEYGLFPFDPFFAEEVLQIRGGPTFNYKLKLKNVTESGWTISQVTKFKSDLDKNFVQYTQSFPEKALEGDYEIIGSMFGSKMANKGRWNLTLYDLVQTTTIRWKLVPSDGVTGKLAPKLKVNVEVQSIRNLDLHISNLLGGRAIILEGMLDRMINTAWQPGFVIIRPLINDLVSTAFTDIFNRAFGNFPFERLIQ